MSSQTTGKRYRSDSPPLAVCAKVPPPSRAPQKGATGVVVTIGTVVTRFLEKYFPDVTWLDLAAFFKSLEFIEFLARMFPRPGVPILVVENLGDYAKQLCGLMSPEHKEHWLPLMEISGSPNFAEFVNCPVARYPPGTPYSLWYCIDTKNIQRTWVNKAGPKFTEFRSIFSVTIADDIFVRNLEDLVHKFLEV